MKPYYDEGGITIYLGDCLEVLALQQAALFDSPRLETARPRQEVLV